MNIAQLPLDAWVIVMLHIDASNLLHVFNCLFCARAIAVPLSSKLDAFWIVVSQARCLQATASRERAVPFPDVQSYRTAHEMLSDMGLHVDVIRDVVDTADGDVYQAMWLLGWMHV